MTVTVSLLAEIQLFCLAFKFSHVSGYGPDSEFFFVLKVQILMLKKWDWN